MDDREVTICLIYSTNNLVEPWGKLFFNDKKVSESEDIGELHCASGMTCDVWHRQARDTW